MTHSDQVCYVYSRNGAVLISLCIQNRFRVSICFILFVQYHCMRWTKATIERILWYSSRSHRLRLFHSIIEPTAVNRFGFSTPDAAFVLQMRRNYIHREMWNWYAWANGNWKRMWATKIEKRLWHLCWNMDDFNLSLSFCACGRLRFFFFSLFLRTHSSQRCIKHYVRFWANSIISKIRI